MKSKNSGKILIVPRHHGKTIEFKFDRTKKIMIALSCIFVLTFSWFVASRYIFYRDQVYALLYDYSINSSSINQISNDGVQTRIDLMRLKTEIDLTDKFLAQSAQMDNEIRTSLRIPHSNQTFADIFQQSHHQRPVSYPASSSEPMNERTQLEILESQERQKSYQDLMDRTPSGHPVKGKMVDARNIIHGAGVVISAPVGTLIQATATGKVLSIRTMENSDFYLIEIEHPADASKDVVTRYLHCTNVLVYEGQEINKGQVIGYVGLLPCNNEPAMGYQLLINKMLIQP